MDTKPGSTAMMLSIIIPSYNRVAVLQGLLETLPATIPNDLSAEVIVIDDRSTDGTSDLVSSKFPWVKLILGPGKGAGLAKRAGVEASKGDFIVALDDDVELHPNWLVSIRHHLTGEYLVQSKLVFVDLGQRELEDESPRNFRAGFRWDMMPITVLNGGSRPQRIHMCHEFGLFIPRRVLAAVPWDDPSIAADFGEAASFFLRVTEAGYEVHFEPGSVIYHMGALAGGCVDRNAKKPPTVRCGPFTVVMVRNFILFARWKSPWKVPLLLPYYLTAGLYLTLKQRQNCFKYFLAGIREGVTARRIAPAPYAWSERNVV